MSRLELPLIPKRLQSTGDIVLHAELTLEIKTDRGMWEEVTFLVDPGTEMTTMEAAKARSLDFPLPRKPIPGLMFKGQEVRSGLLRARVAGMDPTEYVFPCYFLGDPNVAPPAQAKNLLGLTGVINQLRLSFDGRPYPGAQGGILVVETY